MNVEIKCNGCDKEMEVVDVISFHPSSVKILVKPCNNTDCYDCSQCDDNTRLGKEVTELKRRLDHIQSIATTIEKEGKKQSDETNNS